jgi:hypothetical protein
VRKIKKLSLAMILAGVATFSVVSFAEDVTRKDAKKKTESCCAMECCTVTDCCKGDSCEMKDGAKNHSSKHDGCCCCKGDSCEMGGMKKDKQG